MLCFLKQERPGPQLSGQLQTETKILRGTKTEPIVPAVFIQLLSELRWGVKIHGSEASF